MQLGANLLAGATGSRQAVIFLTFSAFGIDVLSSVCQLAPGNFLRPVSDIIKAAVCRSATIS